MKIAIWYNLPSGGAKRALYDQVQGLLRAGHEVEAWCPPTVSQEFLPLSGLIKENVVPLEKQGRGPRTRSGLDLTTEAPGPHPTCRPYAPVPDPPSSQTLVDAWKRLTVVRADWRTCSITSRPAGAFEDS